MLLDKLEEGNTVGKCPHLPEHRSGRAQAVSFTFTAISYSFRLFWPNSVPSCLFVAGLWIRPILLSNEPKSGIQLVELFGMGKWFTKLKQTQNCWWQWEFRCSPLCVFLCPSLNSELLHSRAPMTVWLSPDCALLSLCLLVPPHGYWRPQSYLIGALMKLRSKLRLRTLMCCRSIASERAMM